MDDVRKIARLIREDPDVSEEPRLCRCGGELAPGSNECSRPGCPNFLLKGALDAYGWMITKRGIRIDFDDIIDKGNYYVVFVPSPLAYESCNGGRWYWSKHFKYQKFRTQKPVWPSTKRPGVPGHMRGGWLVTRTHKTLTIRKENIDTLVILGEEITPQRWEVEPPPLHPWAEPA